MEMCVQRGSETKALLTGIVLLLDPSVLRHERSHPDRGRNQKNEERVVSKPHTDKRASITSALPCVLSAWQLKKE